MSSQSNDAYFKVKDEHGDSYLCPVGKVSDSNSISEDELEDCIGEEIIGRYSGNINIKK